MGGILLVVAIVGGAIFTTFTTLGDQSIESITGFEGQSIEIDDFGMTASGLQLSAGAYGADNIKLKEVKISDSETSEVVIPLNQEIGVGDNNIMHLPHLSQTDSSNDIDIEFLYDAGDLENITASGTTTERIRKPSLTVKIWERFP